MKKAIRTMFALMLVFALALTMPLTAFAGSFYDFGDYGGKIYYVATNCTTRTYSCSTSYEGTYYVYVDADWYGETTSGKVTRIGGATSTPAIFESGLSGTSNIALCKLVTTHYVDNTTVRSLVTYV